MLDILPVIGAFVLGLLAGSFLACWYILSRGRRIAEEYHKDLSNIVARGRQHGFLIVGTTEEVVCWHCGNEKPDVCHAEKVRSRFIVEIRAHNVKYNHMLMKHFGVME